jgi:hypothetical protein
MTDLIVDEQFKEESVDRQKPGMFTPVSRMPGPDNNAPANKAPETMTRSRRCGRRLPAIGFTLPSAPAFWRANGPFHCLRGGNLASIRMETYSSPSDETSTSGTVKAGRKPMRIGPLS